MAYKFICCLWVIFILASGPPNDTSTKLLLSVYFLTSFHAGLDTMLNWNLLASIWLHRRKLLLSEANWLLVTTRKRSLGQGNVFTPVCQLFSSWGGVLGCHFLSWKAAPPIAPPPGQDPLSGQQAGGMHSTEMLSCYIHLTRGIDLFKNS